MRWILLFLISQSSIYAQTIRQVGSELHIISERTAFNVNLQTLEYTFLDAENIPEGAYTFTDSSTLVLWKKGKRKTYITEFSELSNEEVVYFNTNKTLKPDTILSFQDKTLITFDSLGNRLYFWYEKEGNLRKHKLEGSFHGFLSYDCILLKEKHQYQAWYWPSDTIISIADISWFYPDIQLGFKMEKSKSKGFYGRFLSHEKPSIDLIWQPVDMWFHDNFGIIKEANEDEFIVSDFDLNGLRDSKNLIFDELYNNVHPVSIGNKLLAMENGKLVGFYEVKENKLLIHYYNRVNREMVSMDSYQIFEHEEPYFIKSKDYFDIIFMSRIGNKISLRNVDKKLELDIP